MSQLSGRHRPLIRAKQQSAPDLGGFLSRFNSKKGRVSFERQRSELTPMTSIKMVEQVAPNARRFGESFRTLLRWKDSVYRLIWRHMLIYYILYVSISIVHDFFLNKDQQKVFHEVTRYVKRHQSSFNLMIMLGFFTSAALQRLFTTQTTMPGTAKVISTFVMSLKTDLPEGKFIVKQFSRWAVLSWLLSFRMICKPLRTIYPDIMRLQTDGLVTEWERVVLERVETQGDNTPRPLIVIDWMLLLLKESMQRDRYSHSSSHGKNVEAVMAFKKSCGNIIKLATKNIPFAVIQAVIISVYFFGMVTILARDFTYDAIGINDSIDVSGSASGEQGVASFIKNMTLNAAQNSSPINAIFSYFPIIPGMQFFIFFSWLTFGRAAVNPFGDDYTDIDIIHLLNSHIEDSIRLRTLYSLTLDDVFPNLPQKIFHKTEAGATALMPKHSKNKKLGEESQNQPEFQISVTLD